MEKTFDYYDFFISNNKSGWKTRETTLKNKEPEIYENVLAFINNTGLTDLTFKQQVWHFINNKPETPICPECGKELMFKRSLRDGYGKYCSILCTNKHKDHIEKIKKGNIKKYGGVAPIHSKNIKEKIKNTNMKRYGVDNTWRRLDLVSDGFIRNHGVSHVSKINGIEEKRRNTNLKKYGYKNNLCDPLILNKTYNTRRKMFLDKYGDYMFNNHTGDTLSVVCDKCNTNYEINRALFRYRNGVNVNPCTICNPINESVSIQEKELQDFIIKLLDTDIILNDREVIKPKELDILIPEYNIGVEFNGLYWHNSMFVKNRYHLNKTKLAEINGLNLIQIFEDEWVYKKEIVMSILKNRFGIMGSIIYGRKCEIRVVKNGEHNHFLNTNHIQGKIGSSVKLGLYYGGDLVSIMTFGKLRKVMGSKSSDGEWELIRFCNKLNTSVVGGASKLFKHFIKNYKPNKIISYSDNRLFNGGLYNTIGFSFDKNTTPNYFYVINNERKHRFNFRKDVLVKEGFDPNKTEQQIMQERGIYRIYDCGNKKWVWNKI